MGFSSAFRLALTYALSFVFKARTRRTRRVMRPGMKLKNKYRLYLVFNLYFLLFLHKETNTISVE